MNNIILIVTLGALGAVLILASVIIFVFVPGDRASAIAHLIAVGGLLVPALLTLKSSVSNAGRLDAVHTLVNAQSDAKDREIAALHDTIQLLQDEAAALKQMIALAKEKRSGPLV